MLKVILSFIPICIIFFMIFFLKKSSVSTGIISCIVTVTLSLLPVFHTSPNQLFSSVIKGSLLTAMVSYVLFFGILLFHLMDKAGAIQTIASSIASSTKDPIHQVLMLAFGFSPLVEAVSGFGLAVIVIAPILMALGFNSWKSVLISLVSLCMIPWGTLAMGTVIGANIGRVPLNDLGTGSALLCIPTFIYFGIVVTYIAVGKLFLKRIGEVVCIGALLSLSVWLCNRYVSVELAGLFSSLVVMTVILGLIWLDRKRKGNLRNEVNVQLPNNRIEFITAISPYLFLIITLFASRLIPSLKDMLSSVLQIHLPTYQFQLALLYSPGFLLLLSCIFTIIVFRIQQSFIIDSIKQTIQKCIPVVVTTLVFVVISEIMSEAKMIQVLSNLATDLFGSFFLYISPLIGGLGGFLTGSNTASNTMFIQLQTQTAAQVGLPPILLACAQNVSSSLLIMTTPSRVTLGASVCKVNDKEGEILKMVAMIGLGTLIIIILELSFISIFKLIA